MTTQVDEAIIDDGVDELEEEFLGFRARRRQPNHYIYPGNSDAGDMEEPRRSDWEW